MRWELWLDEIRVEHSEFFANTVDYERWREPGHNIYIGRQKRFVARFNWFHGAVAGHNVKSRAATNIISYNLIEDGPTGVACPHEVLQRL